MITVDQLAVEFSGTTLFSDVSFVINPTDKIALMGKNGAGKSTMMKIIAGEQTPTRGNVRAPKDVVIAYLPQHLLTEDDCTVFDEAAKAFKQVFSMKEEMDRLNQAKARKLYGALDSSDGFYQGHAQPDCRSLMNVTFRLPTSELDDLFVESAEAEGLCALRGHRSVGGIRASIYNAVPDAGVAVLAEFMRQFRAKFA